jgi:hypothetical protein
LLFIHRIAEKGSSQKLISNIVNETRFAPVRGIVAIITCAGRARGTLLDKIAPPLPSASHGPGVLCCGKGFRRTMNTVFYAMIYIVAASVMIVTVAFLVVVTALT